MKTRLAFVLLLLISGLGLVPAQASSHREALAVLNEPCADNTDTYAWVKPDTHDKLYLIMNFNPLHEPGQGNQGFRACNGYRYEFHSLGSRSSLLPITASSRATVASTRRPCPTSRTRPVRSPDSNGDSVGPAMGPIVLVNPHSIHSSVPPPVA